MGGVLCRPLRRHRCRDQSRKPWRERPRCARWKWPRACPEGSLAMAVSVGVGADDRAALSTKAVNCAADLVLNRGHFVRTTWSRSCGKSWSQSRTRSARDDATDPAPAVVTIVARFWARIRATSCTSSDAPTITPSMLDLCSAPSKARRFAPPAHARGLRALTVPARRSRLGHYVMVGSLMTLSWTDLDR